MASPGLDVDLTQRAEGSLLIDLGRLDKLTDQARVWLTQHHIPTSTDDNLKIRAKTIALVNLLKTDPEGDTETLPKRVAEQSLRYLKIKDGLLSFAFIASCALRTSRLRVSL